MRLLASLFAVLVSTEVGPRAQVAPAAEYLAFRVDDERLIATVLIRDPTPPQIREGLSPAPVSRYGYRHFAVPPWWQERQPFEVPQADRWAVHVSPDDVIDAVAEEVVGGYAGCQEAVGVLLRAIPPHASTLAASPARVATPSSSARR